MKKTLLTAILALTACAALAEPPYSVAVTNIDQVIVPMKNLSGVPAWTAGATNYQGRATAYSGTTYWCMTAGTNSLTAPTTALLQTNGTAVIRRYSGKSARRGLVIVNTGTNAVYLAVGETAVQGAGITLTGRGSAWEVYEPFNEAVHAISGDAAATTLSILDR